MKGEVRPAHIRLYSRDEVKELKDLVTGQTITAKPCMVREGFEQRRYMEADIILEPGVFRKFKWM